MKTLALLLALVALLAVLPFVGSDYALSFTIQLLMFTSLAYSWNIIGGYAGYKNGQLDAVLTYTKVNNAAGTDDRHTWLLGGNYDFKVVKAYAAYATVKGTASADVRDWLLGLTAPVGSAGTVIASFAKKNNRAVSNADAKQWAVGYSHALSKRTNLYTSYGRLSNDSGSSLRVPVAGNTASEFNVGIRHFF